MENKIVLKEMGLTDGEIRVYLSLLNLGSVTVGPIIHNSNISSSKVYIILDKLIQKGLVSYIFQNKTKHFQAAPPVALRDYLERKEIKLKETKSELDKVIEKLEMDSKDTPIKEEARIYRGYDGIKTAWHEAIKSIQDGGDYYFFSVGYGEDEYLQQFFRKLAISLRKRKINIIGIANISEKKLFYDYYKKLGYKMRYTNIRLPSDISIADKYLIMFAWDKKEPVVYVIQSKILVEYHLSFLKSLWASASE